MPDDKGALKRKLGYLTKITTDSNAAEARLQNNSPGSILSVPGNWQPMGEFTYFRRQKAVLPFMEYLANYGDCLQLPETGFGLEDLLFFDTETTGLSGGAGNYIFLLGLGWFTKTAGSYDFIIEQVFLDDFPGENEFISYLSKKLTSDKLYVSYNGKTFDAHLLKTRFLLNRQELDIPHQLDLLHLTRFFCKNTLNNCSLSCVENKLLKVFRQEDVPGALIPDLYLNYLRHRQADTLTLVFTHNFQDILSLAQLFILMERVLGCEDLPIPLEWSKVGEYLLKRKRSKTGLLLLEKMFKKGDLSAGQVLSLYYKKMRLWDKAVLIWQEMAARQNNFAKLELAKHLEHRIKDYAGALFWVESLEKDYRKYGYRFPQAMKTRTSIVKRKKRLMDKIGRQTGD